MTTASRNSAPFEEPEHGLQLRPQLLDGFSRERAAGFRLELARAAVLLDLLARPFDRVLLRVEQMLDEHDQLDLAPLIHAIARAILGGIQEPELALPVAQHVGLEVGELANLADRKELLNGLRGLRRKLRRRHTAHRPSAFSSRSIRSLIA